MKRHWLYSFTTHRHLWIVAIIVLALSLTAEFFIHVHAYFSIAGLFGFNAGYGFLSGIILVILARLLGLLITRREDYYDR